jgi:hypothetical protein
MDALAGKLDQFFVLCDAVRLDSSLLAHLGVDATGKDCWIRRPPGRSSSGRRSPVPARMGSCRGR